MPENPEIRVTKPLPVDQASKQRPSRALMILFGVALLAIVVPLVWFIGAIAMGSQAGLNMATVALKWSFLAIGALLAYGFAVGVYHTFLALTGLDRGVRK